MISRLSIRNYALIRSLNIEPHEALNIITGETGAGKSIMLGAVGLLLGDRADVKALLDREQKCVIEGEFDISELDLGADFEAWDVDYDDHSILRREINPKGKSRAFINDQPTTLDVLKSIGERLVDIHSQNESVALKDKEVKMRMVDGYAQSKLEVNAYQSSFQDHIRLSGELRDLQERRNNASADADYKKFLLDELVNAGLVEGELEGLEEEQKILENAEDIKLKLSQVYGDFDVSDFSINDRLKQAVNILRSVSAFSTDLEKLADRLDSASTEIFDIISDVSNIQEDIEHNPQRITEVGDRLDLLNRLMQKHQVSTVEQLIDIQTDMENETMISENLDESIDTLSKEVDEAAKEVLAKAESLSEKRRSILDELSNGINKLLAEIGMPDGLLQIAYKRVEPWKLGIDEVEFLFSANKGVNPQPVAKVASGGEFSRLMFCIKYMLAQKTAMPTVVFDEIDTGVSGEIAIKMGDLMKRMSAHHQIISISHLPQVAAKGDAHYYVYKDSSAETTESLIRKLSNESRLEEIAKMIGGDQPSETARNSARELIGSNA